MVFSRVRRCMRKVFGIWVRVGFGCLVWGYYFRFNTDSKSRIIIQVSEVASTPICSPSLRDHHYRRLLGEANFQPAKTLPILRNWIYDLDCFDQ